MKVASSKDAGAVPPVVSFLLSPFGRARIPAARLGLNVKDLDPRLDDTLLELNHLYSEMGQRAVTDFDEFNYHNNEIVNIIEGPGVQLFFRNDKDWHYRREERRWVSLHVESCWYRSIFEKGKVKRSKLYIS